MKHCPLCGASVQNGFAFCPRCGGEMAPEELRYDSERNRTEDRSRIRLKELDERFEVLPAVYTPQRRGPIGDDYYPAWKDRDPLEEPPAVVRYRDLDEDRGGFGWWLLGFLLPIAGLMVFLLSREEMPGRSRSAGNGAFVNLILLAVIAGISAVLFMNGYLIIS